ncbi:MAG: response regulator [Candidatus Omnitrophica bacterium]|nr:response regulator [Candidatus Omnitrophota bacterium]
MHENTLKVLVVDDEEGILDLTQRILRHKCGYDTVGTTDGEEAVKLFVEHSPDICILDVHLDDSVLSGIDVLREVRKIAPNAQCIMITRITEEHTIKQSKELGAAAYLLKPLDTKEWLDVVKELADGILKGRP